MISFIVKAAGFFFKYILLFPIMCLPVVEEEQQWEGIPTGERLDHCETGENDYCPRSFRKMPHRRATDTEPMDRIQHWAVQSQGQWRSISTGLPQTDTEDDHPILRKKVEAAVQSLKKGKSAGTDNIPAELAQAGGQDVITTLTTICNEIWQTGEWPTPWTQCLVIILPKKGNLQQCQNYRKQSASPVTQATSCWRLYWTEWCHSREDHHWRRAPTLSESSKTSMTRPLVQSSSTVA